MADSEATWRLAPVRSCHHPSREVQLKGATEGEVKNSEPSKIPWVPPISQMQLKKTAGQPLTLKKKKKKIPSFAICRCPWCKYSQLANLQWLAQSLGARLGWEAQLHTIIMFPPHRYTAISNLMRRNSQKEAVKSLGNDNFRGYVLLLLLNLHT